MKVRIKFCFFPEHRQISQVCEHWLLGAQNLSWLRGPIFYKISLVYPIREKVKTAMLSTFRIQLWPKERGFTLLVNKMGSTQKLKYFPMIFQIVTIYSGSFLTLIGLVSRIKHRNSIHKEAFPVLFWLWSLFLRGREERTCQITLAFWNVWNATSSKWQN